MDSILTSIKKLLGITEEYTHFDADLIMHINSTFMILKQLGVGPPNGFRISNSSSEWSDFIPIDDKRFESVKSYVYMKVRLLFDPPASSIAMDSMNRLLSEFEWRLNVEAESSGEEEIQNG